MGLEGERHAAETVSDIVDPRAGFGEMTEQYKELAAEQAVDEFFDTFFEAVDTAEELVEEHHRREEAARQNTCHDGDDPFGEGDAHPTPPELQLREPNTSYPGDAFDPDVDGTDDGFPVT